MNVVGCASFLQTYILLCHSNALIENKFLHLSIYMRSFDQKRKEAKLVFWYLFIHKYNKIQYIILHVNPSILTWGPVGPRSPDLPGFPASP